MESPTLGAPTVTNVTFNPVIDNSLVNNVAMAPPNEWPVTWNLAYGYLTLYSPIKPSKCIFNEEYAAKNPSWTWHLQAELKSVFFVSISAIKFFTLSDPLNTTVIA